MLSVAQVGRYSRLVRNSTPCVTDVLTSRRSNAMLYLSRRLIVSLCAGDAMVSVGIMALVGHQETLHLLSDGHPLTHTCVTVVLLCLRVASHVISLLNLVALALDHYVAILKPLNYRNVMTRGRTNVLVVLLWGVAVVLGFSKFYFPNPLYSYCDRQFIPDYCELVFCSKYQAEYVVFAMAILSFLVMSFCYVQIFRVIQKCNQFQSEIRASVKKNRRGLVTTLVILFIFLVCWLPYCLFEVCMVILLQLNSSDAMMTLKYMKMMNEIDYYLYDLLLLNSILDPLVYAVRMTEIRKGYGRMFCAPCRKRRLQRDFASLGATSSRCGTSVTMVPSPKQRASQTGNKTAESQV